MYRSIILPKADQDIRDAAKWYHNRQPGLGKRFTTQVRKNVRFICQNPKAVAIRYANVRTLPIDVFPYMIHYTINEAQKLVIVSAVFSTHRDPDIWKEREDDAL